MNRLRVGIIVVNSVPSNSGWNIPKLAEGGTECSPLKVSGPIPAHFGHSGHFGPNSGPHSRDNSGPF